MALILFALTFVTAAGEYYPTPAAHQERGATFDYIIVWAFFVGVVWAGRWACRSVWSTIRTSKQRMDEPSAQAATMNYAHIDERKRIGRELQGKIEKQRIAENARKIERQNPELRQTSSDKASQRQASLKTVEAAVRDIRVTPPVPRNRKPRASNCRAETVSAPVRDHSSGWAGFITYSDAKGDITERRIVVKRIEGYGQPETIFAWCCEREGYRTFLVSRILELVCAETGEVLNPKSHFKQLTQEGAIGTTDKSLADLVTIMVFLARSDGEFHPLEMDSIDKATVEHMMTFGGEPKAIKKAAKKARQLAPDADDFMAALRRIEKHPQRAKLAGFVVDAAEDIIASDGKVSTVEERWYQAVFDALACMAE